MITLESSQDGCEEHDEKKPSTVSDQKWPTVRLSKACLHADWLGHISSVCLNLLLLGAALRMVGDAGRWLAWKSTARPPSVALWLPFPVRCVHVL